MLHVTNGDAVLDGFRQVRFRATIWPGATRSTTVRFPRPHRSRRFPISARVRCRIPAGSYDDIRLEFAERDRTLAGFRDHDETVLWFEHDLYDQLQLFQLLDWLSRQDRAGVRLSLIQVGEHPDVPSFHGLGELNGKQLAALLPDRLPVTEKHLVLGREAWAAVCSDDPTSLVGLASRRDPELPFRGPALYRMLEEYPSVSTGLSRTERQLLAAGVAGARHRRELLREVSGLRGLPMGRPVGVSPPRRAGHRSAPRIDSPRQRRTRGE